MLDAPIWVHWPKLGLWMTFEAVLLALTGYLERQQLGTGAYQPPGTEGDCEQWEYNCSFDGEHGLKYHKTYWWSVSSPGTGHASVAWWEVWVGVRSAVSASVLQPGSWGPLRHDEGCWTAFPWCGHTGSSETHVASIAPPVVNRNCSLFGPVLI